MAPDFTSLKCCSCKVDPVMGTGPIGSIECATPSFAWFEPMCEIGGDPRVRELRQALQRGERQRVPSGSMALQLVEIADDLDAQVRAIAFVVRFQHRFTSSIASGSQRSVAGLRVNMGPSDFAHQLLDF
jgi:hypothetical protein